MIAYENIEQKNFEKFNSTKFKFSKQVPHKIHKYKLLKILE